MNARIVGSGEQTLVLAHGYGGSQSVWDDVVPSLSQRSRVVVFDWSFSSLVAAAFDESSCPFFGQFADELISMLDEMKMKGVVYVGHSMAGMIGCVASVRRPDLFSHLVLIGASPRYLNAPDYRGGFEREEVDSMLRAIESSFATWAKGFAALAVGVPDPASTDKFCRSFLSMRPETALSVARAVFLSDLRGVLEKVEAPCTIIQGANDVVVPASVAHYMKGKVKGTARVEIVEGDGHFPQLTCPKLLVGIIDRVFVPKKW